MTEELFSDRSLETLERRPLAGVKASDLSRAIELTEFVVHRKKEAKKEEKKDGPKNWLVFSGKGVEIICTDQSRLSRAKVDYLNQLGVRRELFSVRLPSLAAASERVVGGSFETKQKDELFFWQLFEGNLLVTSPLLPEPKVIPASSGNTTALESNLRRFSEGHGVAVKTKVFYLLEALKGLPRREEVVLESEFDFFQNEGVLKIFSSAGERICPVLSLEGEGSFSVQAIYLRQILRAAKRGEILINWGEADEPFALRLPGRKSFVHMILPLKNSRL